MPASPSRRLCCTDRAVGAHLWAGTALLRALRSGYEILISSKRLRNADFVIEMPRWAGSAKGLSIMWYPISNAPFDRDLELGVADSDGVRAISFPCRRILGGWIKAETKTRIDLRPTHWRDWYTDGRLYSVDAPVRRY